MTLLSTADAQALAALLADTLWEQATVYGPAANGAYTQVLRSALACRRADPQPALPAPDRATDVEGRVLYYDAAYAMPRQAQVEVGGVRYQVVPGSDVPWPGPGGVIVYRRCQLTEVR